MLTRLYVEVFSNYLFKVLYGTLNSPFVGIIFIEAQLLKEKQG